MHTLYGDGFHDDTDAIQEQIDSGICELALPAPEKFYLISRPLVLPSHFKLRLPRYAEIRLKDNSNCFMVTNRARPSPASRLRPFLTPDQKALWRFVDELSPDEEDACTDFEIEGGIWNFNNLHQKPNPIYTRRYDADGYLGHTMLFYNVKNFRLSNMTFKDPANYAVMIDLGSYFTIENLVFDFNYGNPIATNMDGVHLNGNCHYGVIRNLQGACYDDLVALNAHEGSGGDITHIEIDGIFAENCHSAVRLLTVNHRVSHITVSNVHGTYYQYGIGFTKYYPGETTGCFDAITLRDIHAAKSVRLPIQEAHMGRNTGFHFPLIWLQRGTHVRSLAVSGLHRREFVNPIPTFCVEEGAQADRIAVRDFTQENHCPQPCAAFVCAGKIGELLSDSLGPADIENTGQIGCLALNENAGQENIT